MSIAYRVQDYIAEHDVPWDVLPHFASQSSMEAARLAHVPPDRVAKAVVLEDDEGYFVAVIPANRRLDLPQLGDALGQHLTLASERALGELFADCVQGAVPAVGDAYGLPTLWDSSLGDMPDVYFEGGDRRSFVHMSGGDFCELMRLALPLRPASHMGAEASLPG